MLIELVVRLQTSVYVVMLEQHAARASVLRKNQVSLFQHGNCPESHILQISHRGRDDVKRALLPDLILERLHFNFLLTAIINL